VAIEREIKLALPPSKHDDVARFFDKRSGPGQRIELENVYFDTPALALAKARAALRLRRTPDAWLQTYKTVGESRAGLHQRHEWELPVKGEALEIDAMLEECDDPQARDALEDAAPRLIAVFRTDYSRIIWNVEHDGACIEAALDLGDITADVDGEKRRAGISELELELKSGDENALYTLSAELRGAFLHLQPEDASKAERGYGLRKKGESAASGANDTFK
jgi:inorganic triphosphatase YgiF